MSAFGNCCKLLILVLLALASYACIYLEFWKPRCHSPFVEIGENCYFFSTNKAPTHEYYKVTYKDRVYSVPAMLDWLHAGFACETLDPRARLLFVRSADDLLLLANYFKRYAHRNTHPFFWSGGHRGSLANEEADGSSLDNFYWHHDAYPMNFTIFADPESELNDFPDGHCIYIQYDGSQMVMAMASCSHRMAYACELVL